MKNKYLLFLVSLIFLSIVHTMKSQNIQRTSFYSNALERVNNVSIYLPPGYTEDMETFYPVIYFLHGWGGSENSAETIMELADSLILENVIEPVIIVCPNNSPLPFSGSYFVNSDLNGAYEDYMNVDLVNWMDNNYRTVAD
ncbi:MAG: alpha/beta hydrolase-fold protein, partial [bacterium]